MNIRIPSIVAEMSKELFCIAPNHLESFMLAAIFPDDNSKMPSSELQQLGVAEHKVNVIPVQGVLMNKSYAKHGIYGYVDMIKDHAEGENNPDVVAHILNISSPGGSVSGLAEAADIIHASTKPVYAYINDLGASAAYYLAAASSHIMTTKRSSMIGNIGSKIGTLDIVGILENFGAKKIEVFGTMATRKDLGFGDAKKGDYTKIREIIIDPANEMFVKDVGRYRPSLQDEHKDGIVYFSETALQHKLVDSLGNFQDLLDRISNDLSINNSIQMSTKVTMLVPNALVGGIKLMGGEVVEATAPTAEIPETDADEGQAQEGTAQAPAPEAEAVNPLQATVNTLTAQVAAQTAQLEKKDQEVAGMKASLEALSNNPAAQRSAARQEGDDKAPETPEAEAEIVMTMSDDYDAQ